MKDIVVASLNPAKLAAVESAFAEAFAEPVAVRGVSVSSGVPDQPMTDKEILTRSSVYHQALILALIPFLNPVSVSYQEP
ncbi:DUF84 family protein [Sansalvadorimonas sp. 2012CJ34-2]|uniref:inosine/xanthosine triphosphatase n=1 Tax=Parendozoicomonas callyspongiae TaxID=2942213 RepID=A0ABT0PBG0_9GAMM|nr:DUF84 family protein [Sansalvadorimonas sp. 2012CJ34-2]MCL6268722.1 DUF84 family protein [Sansalvadorimonas sp. 2012CJ34-2]